LKGGGQKTLRQMSRTKLQPFRVLYAFDPRRTAILLIGGRKTGQQRWYQKHIRIADRLYEEHLEQHKREGLI
jgi:hypothetical protein